MNWKIYCDNSRKIYIATKSLFSLTRVVIVQAAQMMEQPVSARMKRKSLLSHFLLSSSSFLLFTATHSLLWLMLVLERAFYC